MGEAKYDKAIKEIALCSIEELRTKNEWQQKQIAALEAEAVTLKTSNRYMAEIHDTQFVAHEEQITALKAENKEVHKENRRLERDLNLMAQGNFPEHESLKLDIWAEHMVNETENCPPGVRLIFNCRPEFVNYVFGSLKATTKFCVPCWQRFAHGEE